MSALNFLDTNVWLALVWERHASSESARHWFDSRGMAGAWEIYDGCCADERIAFLPEPDGLDQKFRALARGRQSSPNVWADAYLAAFAAAAGLRLVTFDKAVGAQSPQSVVL